MPIFPYREPKIAGSCAEIGGILNRKGVKSVRIVTDRGIVSNGLTDPIVKALEESGIAYSRYQETRPNSTVDNMEAAYKMYLENHCQGLIAVGGGSSRDCAKAVGARAVYPKKSIGKRKGTLGLWLRRPEKRPIPFIRCPS